MLQLHNDLNPSQKRERQWSETCMYVSIAPEGQIERENKDMAKKTLKKSKKLQSAKTLRSSIE